MPLPSSVAAEPLAARIAKAYGFEPVELLPVQKGYRNVSHPVVIAGGRIINVMIFKREPGILRTIENANAVSNFLSARGFPARRTVDGRILTLSSTNKNYQKYAAAYNYLPGGTIPWEAYTQKHIKLLGKTLSDMHAELKLFDDSNLPDISDVYLQLVRRMQGYFGQSGVMHAVSVKLGLHVELNQFDMYVCILKACKTLPNRQALHMDFVRSNILFEDSETGPVISGILDFEKTALGSPLFDIARTLTFLLVDCKYKDPAKVRKYFLYSGYKKRGKAHLPHVSTKIQNVSEHLLETLIDVFLLYDFYKFLRHNPYESLRENEHFIRTRDIILTGNNSFLVKK